VSRVYPFRQVDVFTSRPFLGNPVAVVFDADGLSDEQMQAIARWTNLSETTFFQQPSPNSGADYRLRIFAPTVELPFAGHPTLGSAHAYIERGGARLDPEVLRMECGTGVLALRTLGEGSESIVFSETPRRASFMSSAPRRRRSLRRLAARSRTRHRRRRTTTARHGCSHEWSRRTMWHG